MQNVKTRRFFALMLIVMLITAVFGFSANAETEDAKAAHTAAVDAAVLEVNNLLDGAFASVDEIYELVKTDRDALDELNEELEAAKETEDEAGIAEIEAQIAELETMINDRMAEISVIVADTEGEVYAWLSEYGELFESDEDNEKKPEFVALEESLAAVGPALTEYIAAYADAKLDATDDALDALATAGDDAKAALADFSDAIDALIPADNGPFYSTWLALLPPIIAIGLALITKEVYSSLFIGILAGSLLTANFNPLGTVDTLINGGFISAVSDTAGIFIFLVILGIFVALINKTGAAAAFGKWAQTHVKSRVGAQLATFALGVLIFIDDYFNCLTVGSVMKPVTDAHRVSRAKLAFLIDATAAPICMIAPISSWAAAVAEYAPEGEGLSLFVRAIPFNYYSLMALLFVVLIIVFKVDFGPMAKHEKNAIENGDLFTTRNSDNKVEEEPVENARGRVFDLVIPVIALIGICVFGLVYVGGILDGDDFITAFGNTDATVGLPWGGLIALIITIIYLVCRRVVSFRDAMDCVPKGFIAMVPAITILTFATALKNMTGLLGAKEFIGDLMTGFPDALVLILPAVVFLVACGLAFATGTSWGTFGILIPIVTAMFPPEAGELYIIGMSACLAGAVCGDHCSPISDTTIMSSAGAECDHINHVSTQLPYAITIAACSFVAYIVGGVTQNGWIGLAAAIVVTVGVVAFVKARQNKKAAK